MKFYDLEGNYYSELNLYIDDKIEGEWTKDIYIDQVKHHAFTSSLKNGFMTLYQVDLKNGSLYRVLKTTHSYPEKVMVYDGFLFYLYDKPWEGDEKYLYRQKL
jgi:hypothetical protein